MDRQLDRRWSLASRQDGSRIGSCTLTDLEKMKAGVDELERLDLAGLNDSPEADAIREQMDIPWISSTEDEREIIRAYSVEVEKRRTA